MTSRRLKKSICWSGSTSECLLVSVEAVAYTVFLPFSLTESLEKTRGEKRQLDALLPTLQSQVRSLEGEKATLTQNLVAAQQETTRLAARPDYSAKLAAVEEELRDARDSLQDTLEELEDAKAREAKTRAGLLEELSSVQADLSSTRTKLRQAERKNGAAVK